MQPQRITRRDFLKLLATISALIPASKLLRDASGSGQGTNQLAGPNIIILVFDTLSARNMSLHGYKRKTTPNIEKFAQISTTFRRHYAASSHTKPSTASLLTGVLPWSHRALNFYTALLEFYESENVFSKISPDFYKQAYTHNTYVSTILEQFANYIDLLKPVEELAIYNPNKLPNAFKRDYPMGFYAAKRWRDSYMGPSNSLFLNPLFSIAQGITSSQVYEANEKLYPLGLSDNQEGYLYKLEDAIDWIAQSAGSTSQPYFGYYHLLPPHEAYRPRVDFVGAFSGDGIRLLKKPEHFFTQGQTQEQLEKDCELYDEYIAFVDSEFGRLYGMLEKSGILENAYLILTTDHGQLFERGIHGHGVTVYEPLIHVPLIIHAPGQGQGKDIYSPTSIIDVAPTILRLTNQDLPDWMEGTPLPIFDEAEETGRVIFSIEGKENPKMKPLTKAMFSAIRWPYKLIHYRGYPGYDNIDELFHLDNDPEELDNLAASHPSIVADLKEELRKGQSAAEEKSLGISTKPE